MSHLPTSARCVRPSRESPPPSESSAPYTLRPVRAIVSCPVGPTRRHTQRDGEIREGSGGATAGILSVQPRGGLFSHQLILPASSLRNTPTTKLHEPRDDDDDEITEEKPAVATLKRPS